MNNWKKLKRSTMNPNNTGFKPANYTTPKKKPAKRKPSFEERCPILSKLLDLKKILQKAYEEKRGRFLDADKVFVWDLINDVRNSNIIKLSRKDGLRCNELWRKFK